MDLAIEVFPTPGGPTRHKIGPFCLPSDKVLTAINSKILSFTLFRP